MSRRGADRESIVDRIAATQARAQASEQPTAHVARPVPPPPEHLQHCWVTNHLGRHPGLLLGWRNLAGAWEGRVMHPVVVDDVWLVCEEWLPAAMLEQA